MRFAPITRFFRSSIARLALSYLAIIMLLSIGFSVIFYRTSTASLHLQVAPTGPQGQGPNPTMEQSPPGSVGIVGDWTGSTSTINSSTVSGLNVQLQKRINDLRKNLL